MNRSVPCRGWWTSDRQTGSNPQVLINALTGKVAASTQRNYSDFDWRRITCNTLPLTVGHLDPCMGPSFMYV